MRAWGVNALPLTHTLYYGGLELQARVPTRVWLGVGEVLLCIKFVEGNDLCRRRMPRDRGHFCKVWQGWVGLGWGRAIVLTRRSHSLVSSQLWVHASVDVCVWGCVSTTTRRSHSTVSSLKCCDDVFLSMQVRIRKAGGIASACLLTTRLAVASEPRAGSDAKSTSCGLLGGWRSRCQQWCR